MSELVTLNLGNGDLQTGFPSVIVQLQSQRQTVDWQLTRSLPAQPTIIELYRRWQLLYELLYEARSIGELLVDEPLRKKQDDEGIIIDPEPNVNRVSVIDFYEVGQELKKQIDRWLDAEEFSDIYRQLQQRLDRNQEIRFIIQTENNELRQLPWYIWRFFEDYPYAEVSISPPNIDGGTTAENDTAQVRILAILGDSSDINIEVDKDSLKNLPDAQTVFLVEPQRQEVNEQLWAQQGWDILFFAGHSVTQADGETGCIYLNSTESLTIEQLSKALKEAIKRGLQIAIFNSCDGLGLARQLADLQIPQMIVMREPVPDKVAQEFLRYFLQEFAGGCSFNLAVRRARERLQGIEDKFPGASWLPVTFENPAVVPPTWEGLRGYSIPPAPPVEEKPNPIPPPLPSKVPALLTISFISVAVTILLMAVRSLGILQ
ncbi:MAG: CHAT domain-containing protein, partial [Symploca sp. SIO1A3]|nr:CHAT domain-containing protein [Symploca sp. SIO1A3]